MFLREFGLAVHPFGISPRLDFLYKSGAFEESIAHLVYGLDSNEAIIMITGAIGTGKTMAIQSFLSHLGGRYLTALVTNTSVDAKELLKLVLEDLGLPLEQGADKSDLLIAFKKFLIASGRDGKRIIIVIDEAQNLSREALEEVRLLTNLGQGDEQPVQIVLAGQPELEAALQRADLAQLRQRIRVHYKLAPLSRRELEEYVDHRMTVAGGKSGVFTRPALDRIFALSGGIPRVVNTLCGDALLSAFVAGRREVSAADVEDSGAVAGPKAMDPVAPVVEQAGSAGSDIPPVREQGAGSREPATAPDLPRPDRATEPQMAKRKKPASAKAHDGGRRGGPRVGRVLGAFALVAALVIVGLAYTGRLDWFRPGARVDSADSIPGGSAYGAGVTPQSVLPNSMHAPVVAGESSADTSGNVSVSESLGEAAVDTVAARIEATAGPAPAASLQAPPAPVAAAADAAVLESGVVYIHVSSFRTMDHAASLARQYTDGGVPAIARREIVRDLAWYRVYLGPYASHADAVSRANELRDAGQITYYKVLALDDGEGQ